MRGEAVEEAEIEREIAPCFVEHEGRRTDQIVLACTHFPLILDKIERLSPWPVGFVDPASAIARRLDALIGAARPGASTDHEGIAIFTSGDEPTPALQKTLLLYANGERGREGEVIAFPACRGQVIERRTKDLVGIGKDLAPH